MKSIQIMLLICIHLGETFPVTMEQQAIDANINALLDKGLIDNDLSDMTHGYEVTEKGRMLIHALYDTFSDVASMKY